MSIRNEIPDSIKRASKVIGFATWLDDPDTWLEATLVIGCRLTADQRKSLAYAVLATLSDGDLDQVLSDLCGPSLGVAA